LALQLLDWRAANDPRKEVDTMAHLVLGAMFLLLGAFHAANL
jgi:hypothetical protein